MEEKESRERVPASEIVREDDRVAICRVCGNQIDPLYGDRVLRLCAAHSMDEEETEEHLDWSV